MNLEPGKYYDCYAESAEFHEGKSGGLFLKVKYRFPKTGDVLWHYHQLVGKDGTIREFPVDRNNPDGPKTTEQELIEKRYGVDLSNFEFDQSKLSKDILLRALIKEETREYKGEMRTEIRIRGVYDKDRDDGGSAPPPDKNALMRRFGSALRAGHSSASRPAPAIAKPNAPAPKTPPAPPANKKAPAPAPAATSSTSSLDECWEAFCNANKDVDEGTLTNEWFALLQRTIGHQKQERATPEEWGLVMAAIKTLGADDDVPF